MIKKVIKIAEKEYIEREKAIITYKTFGHLSLHNALEAFKRIPAADVRPVITCSECIYAPSGDGHGFDLEWPHDDWPENNPCPCKCEDGFYSYKPRPNFFCANGKREKNNG